MSMIISDISQSCKKCDKMVIFLKEKAFFSFFVFIFYSNR